MIEFVLCGELKHYDDEFDEWGNCIGKKWYFNSYGYDRDGVRLVRRCESIDKVREMVKWCIEQKSLTEFIGLGWRCVWEDGRYYWTRIRDIEEYGDDLRLLS